MEARPPVVRKKGAPQGAPLPLKHGDIEDRRTLFQKAAANILRWRKEPWSFVRELLGATPDAWQDEVLHALVESGFEMFCMKACKGPGKSTLLAWAGLWFLFCFEDPKVICTSITAENLRDGLWTEFALWMNKNPAMNGLFQWQGERIFLKERPSTWFISARTWPKDADKTKQAATLAGIHSRNSMLLVDEGGDIPEGVVAAGIAHHSTQHEEEQEEVHYTLMAGNPTRLDGALGVACTRDRRRWWVIEITGDPKDPRRAPRIDKQWAQDQIDAWGPDNPWVLVNVFGRFPPTQENKLLGPEAVRRAMEYYAPEPLWVRSPKVMGLDVARSLGLDRSVLCRRQGQTVFPFKEWRIDDLMELCSAVAWEWGKWRADAIFVDVGGLGGGVVDRLNQMGLPAIGISFGQKARDQRFSDKRSEMWWDMHMAIKGNRGDAEVSLPEHSELLAQLVAPEISFNDRGQLKLESKDHMKKRGVASPDYADALCLTWAEPVGTVEEHRPISMPEVVRREFIPYAEESWHEE